jgi:predicted esterase
MSVFKPGELDSLAHAAGHFYFIEHSPEDKVCPFRMAKNAHKMLRENGAVTRLVTYKGGHGWRGNVFGRIRKGIRWLEVAVRKESQKKKPVERKTEPAAGEQQK